MRNTAHFTVWVRGTARPIHAQYRGQFLGQPAGWTASYAPEGSVVASTTIPVKSSYTRSKIVAQVVAWAEGLGLTVTEADGVRL